jgi:hypothetical protein
VDAQGRDEPKHVPPLERQGPHAECTPAIGPIKPPRAKAKGRGRRAPLPSSISA